MAQKVYYGDIRLVTWKDIQDYVGSIMGSLNLEPLKYLEADSSGLSKILTSTKQFDLRNVTETGDAFLTVKDGADVNLKSPGKLRVLSRDELYLRASNTVRTDVGLIASDYTPQYILASTYLRKETGSSGGLVSSFKVSTFTSNANGNNANSGPCMFLGSSTADARNNQARMVTAHERAIVHMENNWAEMTTLNAASQQAGRVISTGTGAAMLSNNGANNFSRLDIAGNYLAYQNNSGYALLAGDESGWPGTIAANTKVDGNFIGTLGNLPAWMDNVYGDENGISKIVFTSTFSLSTKQSGWDKPVISMTNDQYLTVGGYVDADGWVRANKSGTRTVQTLITGEYAAIAAATQSTSTDPAAVDSILLADSRYYGAVGMTSGNTDYQYQGVIQQRTGAMIGMSYCAAEQVLSSSALLNAGTGTGYIQNSVFSPGTKTSSTYADLVEAGVMRLASSSTDPLLTVNSQLWGTQAYVLQAVKDDSAATGTVGGKVYGNMPVGELPGWINNIYGDEDGISAIRARDKFIIANRIDHVYTAIPVLAMDSTTGRAMLGVLNGLGTGTTSSTPCYVLSTEHADGISAGGVREGSISYLSYSSIEHPFSMGVDGWVLWGGPGYLHDPVPPVAPGTLVVGNLEAALPGWIDCVYGDADGIEYIDTKKTFAMGNARVDAVGDPLGFRGLSWGDVMGTNSDGSLTWLRDQGPTLHERGVQLSLGEVYNPNYDGYSLENMVSVKAGPGTAIYSLIDPPPSHQAEVTHMWIMHEDVETGGPYVIAAGYHTSDFPAGILNPDVATTVEGKIRSGADLPVWIDNIHGDATGIYSINTQQKFVMGCFGGEAGVRPWNKPVLVLDGGDVGTGAWLGIRHPYQSGSGTTTAMYGLNVSGYPTSNTDRRPSIGVRRGYTHDWVEGGSTALFSSISTDATGSWALLSQPTIIGGVLLVDQGKFLGTTSGAVQINPLYRWIDAIEGTGPVEGGSYQSYISRIKTSDVFSLGHSIAHQKTFTGLAWGSAPEYESPDGTDPPDPKGITWNFGPTLFSGVGAMGTDWVNVDTGEMSYANFRKDVYLADWWSQPTPWILHTGSATETAAYMFSTGMTNASSFPIKDGSYFAANTTGGTGNAYLPDWVDCIYGDTSGIYAIRTHENFFMGTAGYDGHEAGNSIMYPTGIAWGKYVAGVPSDPDLPGDIPLGPTLLSGHSMATFGTYAPMGVTEAFALEAFLTPRVHMDTIDGTTDIWLGRDESAVSVVAVLANKSLRDYSQEEMARLAPEGTLVIANTNAGSSSAFITEDSSGITGITLSSSGFRMGTTDAANVLELSSDETLSLKAANGIYALSDLHLNA